MLRPRHGRIVLLRGEDSLSEVGSGYILLTLLLLFLILFEVFSIYYEDTYFGKINLSGITKIKSNRSEMNKFVKIDYGLFNYLNSNDAIY